MIKIKTMLRLWMIILFVTAGFSQQVKAQGVDVIFWMDNSGSIDATEWTNMTASTKSIIDQVLGCNPLNRVAVVHYAGTYTGVSPETPKIYIESDFTSNVTTAKNFVRRGGQPTQGGTHYSTMGASDVASEALQVIGNALDATANSNIVSTQKKLTKTANNKLVIFYFTDALRDYISTWMVSQTNTANPFVVYNQFKTDRGATFVVLKAPSGSPTPSLEVAAGETAAAIASVGGSYNGAVESNAGDPQGSGVKPRKAIISSTFSIPSGVITTLATNICKSCAPVVNLSAVTPPSQTVVLNSTAQNLVSTATGQGTLSYQWYSNTTNSTTGGTLITGATSATYTPPTSAVGTTYYYVVVSDSYCEGKATSAIVSVLISDPCEITASNPDSDGDGISDFCDLDDDNDGILDTAENSCNLTTSTTWSGTGSTVTGTNGSGVTANNITMTSVITTGTNTGFTASPNGAFNTTNFWSNSAVAGANSLQFVHAWDTDPENTEQANVDGGTRTYTITFAKPVNKAIIHLDRLGGNYQIPPANYFSNSTEFTLTSSGISMKKLAGNNQLIVTGNKFYRSVGDDLGSVNPGSEANNTKGTAAGSIEFSSATGQLFNSLTFTVIGQGIEGSGNDGMEFIIESCIGTDTDGDGIPNQLDLDSDGDGCPDAIEGGANFVDSDLEIATGTIASQTPNQNLGNSVDANGVPTIAGTGQTVNNATNSFVNDCITTSCPPDPYAAQKSWWLSNKGDKVRIDFDFQTGSPVLNNPPVGFLGQGNTVDGQEGNTTVTHPVTGELLFVTDGSNVYRGSDGAKATGYAGGSTTSAEAAAVIPDPQGVLGKDFIIFGNSASSNFGSITGAKYNLETNTIHSTVTYLAGTTTEALEVIPHTNGTDYWVLVTTADQKTKSFLYSKTSGFNTTPVSSIDVLPAENFATNSFISWDPRIPGKVLIARQNKVGLANFNPSTGVLGTWQVYITVNHPNPNPVMVWTSYVTGYGAALSPNGQYIYYQEHDQPNNRMYLKYYDLINNTTTTLDYTIGVSAATKIAPDGKLYRIGYVGPAGSAIAQLFYINADANTPPATAGSQVQFNTGGRQVSSQLPNNTYWACITCQSGSDAPVLTNPTITSNPATVGALIALLSASNKPAGTVITIHSGATATDANKLANSTAIVPGTTYYASFFDGLAVCYSPTTAVTVGLAVCFNDPKTGGTNNDTKVGITLLKRAGANNTDNWPMVRKSGFIALESNTQGFVVTRMTTAQLAAIKDANNAVEGMMSYDTDAQCLKIYDGTDWKCFSIPSCP